MRQDLVLLIVFLAGVAFGHFVTSKPRREPDGNLNLTIGPVKEQE